MLHDKPHCREFRGRHLLGIKVFDFCLLTDVPRCLFFDSDLAFFAPPTEVLSRTRAGQAPNAFIEDVWTNYIADPEQLQLRFGIQVPGRVNIGFGVLNAANYDLEFVEEVLADKMFVDAPYLHDQTLIAIVAARDGLEVLGGPYRMTLNPGIDEHIVKHYTRCVRHRMYTEAIPFLYKKYLRSEVLSLK
jgi:hypothetical protein